MEEYRDLHLTIAVFTRLLEQPKMQHLEAGIVLQAYLPDAVAALQALTGWAKARRAAGGAGIKVRIVKGANLAMERVDATVHDWPLATWSTKQDSDTNYKRMLVRALTPENLDAVRIGVAGHNLFDLAFAWLLAQRRARHRRASRSRCCSAWRPPRPTPCARRRAACCSTRRSCTPRSSTPRSATWSAASRRTRAPTTSCPACSSWTTPGSTAASATGSPHPSPISTSSCPRRTARRTACTRRAAARPVATSRTRPTPTRRSPPNREWARGILTRSADSRARARRRSRPRPSARRSSCARSSPRSAAGRRDAGARVPGGERADLLDRVGEVLSVFRGRLIEVMASETGKTVAEADVEVSEVIDFAHFYAARARELAAVEDAVFEPVGVTAVIPPWNFPVAIPGGGVLVGARRRQRRALQARRGRRSAAAPSSPRRCGRPGSRATWSRSSTCRVATWGSSC